MIILREQRETIMRFNEMMRWYIDIERKLVRARMIMNEGGTLKTAANVEFTIKHAGPEQQEKPVTNSLTIIT